MSKYATKEQLISIVQDMASKISVPTIGIGGGYAPIGTVISYMGVTAPQDYLACDGSTYNISAYSDLADFFESQFGSKNYFGGDGTTTFAVPDLRGEFLRGTGTNNHENQGSGATVGTHQDATKHQYISTDTTGSVIYAAAPITRMSNYDNRVTSGTEQKRVETTSLSDLTDQVQNFTSRPTNTSILWCIKAVNAGDVYSTDERVVGTWIDGKPIYQKTVEITLPDCEEIGIPVYQALVNFDFAIDALIYIGGFFSISSAIMPIPFSFQQSDKWMSAVGARITISSGVYKLQVYNSNTNWNGATGYVTLQYTKNTD